MIEETIEVDNELREKAEQFESERLALKKAFQQVFGSKDGQKVLLHLNEKVFQPVVRESDPDPFLSAALRQGEQNLVMYIHRLMRVNDGK
jgi:hypothetical protein